MLVWLIDVELLPEEGSVTVGSSEASLVHLLVWELLLHGEGVDDFLVEQVLGVVVPLVVVLPAALDRPRLLSTGDWALVMFERSSAPLIVQSQKVVDVSLVAFVPQRSLSNKSIYES